MLPNTKRNLSRIDRAFLSAGAVACAGYAAYSLIGWFEALPNSSIRQFVGILAAFGGAGVLAISALKPPEMNEFSDVTGKPAAHTLWLAGFGVLFFGAGGFSAWFEALDPTVRGAPATDPGDVLGGRILFGGIAIGCWALSMLTAVRVAAAHLHRSK